MCRLRPFVYSSINPSFFCGRGGFYALRVYDRVARACIVACVSPHLFHQRCTDLFPKPASDCGVIKVGHCCVWWKIVGQISPFASVIYEIQYSIYQFPFFPFAPVSCPGKQRLYDRPLAVAQIARITASLIFLYHASSIPSFPLLVQLLNFAELFGEVKSVLAPRRLIASSFILYACALSLGRMFSCWMLLSTIKMVAVSSSRLRTRAGGGPGLSGP